MNDADRKIVERLQHALDAIDIAIMPADQQRADTKAVGRPVSLYSIDYDEQGVVRRVRDFVKSQALSARARRFLANYLRTPRA